MKRCMKRTWTYDFTDRYGRWIGKACIVGAMLLESVHAGVPTGQSYQRGKAPYGLRPALTTRMASSNRTGKRIAGKPAKVRKSVYQKAKPRKPHGAPKSHRWLGRK